jgi:hypothetical protein
MPAIASVAGPIATATKAPSAVTSVTPRKAATLMVRAGECWVSIKPLLSEAVAAGEGYCSLRSASAESCLAAPCLDGPHRRCSNPASDG